MSGFSPTEKIYRRSDSDAKTSHAETDALMETHEFGAAIDMFAGKE